MGVRISHMNSVYNRLDSYSDTVINLATRALSPILQNGAPKHFSHVVVATTCPDTLAPTLGQTLNQFYYPRFANCHVLDLVQGCAGGVSALVLASQLTELTQSNVAVVLADAARQSVSESNKIREFFGNGAFACTIEFENGSRKLIHHKTKQYENLSELVTVKLGHRAHHEIISKKNEVIAHPLENLGLSMNPLLALKLLRHAEEFYHEFVNECKHTPDVMVFHQVNPDILRSLQGVFEAHVDKFVNLADTIGNCGAASFAIAMDTIKDELSGKKVFLCSFGTGGVISAGLWQF
jgi:3-oxoacyl-[acyl-carrier-protein] synthase III